MVFKKYLVLTEYLAKKGKSLNEATELVAQNVTPIRIQPPRRAKRAAKEPATKSTPSKTASTKRRGRPPKKPKEFGKEVADVIKPREADLLVSRGVFFNLPLKPPSISLSSLLENYKWKCISMDDQMVTDEMLYGSVDQWKENSKLYFEYYKKIKSAEYSAMIKNDTNKNNSLYDSFSVQESKYDSFEDSLNEEPEDKAASGKHLSIRKAHRRKSQKQSFYDSLEDVCSSKSHLDKSSISCENSNVNTNLDDSLKSSHLNIKFTSNECRYNNHVQSNIDEDSLAVPDIENTFDDSIEEINMISSIDELNDLESIAEMQIPDLELCEGSNQQSGVSANICAVEVIYERDGFQAIVSDKLSDPQSKLYDSLSDSDGKDLLVDSLNESGSGGCASSSEPEVYQSLSSINEPEKVISVSADVLDSSADLQAKISRSPCFEPILNSDCHAKPGDDLASFMNRYSSKENIDVDHRLVGSAAKTVSLENNAVLTDNLNSSVKCTPVKDSAVDCIPDKDSVDSIPDKDSVVDYIPDKDSVVDYIPDKDSVVDYIPDKDSVDSIPDKDSVVDSIPDKDSVVDSIPDKDSVVDYIPDKDSVVDYILDKDSVVDYIPDKDSTVDCILNKDSSVHCTPDKNSAIEDIHYQSDSNVENASHLNVCEGNKNSQLYSIFNKTFNIKQESDYAGKSPNYVNQADFVQTDSKQASVKNVTESRENHSDRKQKETITVDASQLNFLKDKFNIDLDVSKFELEIEVTVGDNKCKIASESVKIVPVTGGKNKIIGRSDSVESRKDSNDYPETFSPENNCVDKSNDVSLVSLRSVSESVSSEIDSDLNLNKSKLSKQFSEEDNILSPNLESDASNLIISKKSLSRGRVSKSKLYDKATVKGKDINSATHTNDLGLDSGIKMSLKKSQSSCKQNERASDCKSLSSNDVVKPISKGKRPSSLPLRASLHQESVEDTNDHKALTIPISPKSTLRHTLSNDQKSSPSSADCKWKVVNGNVSPSKTQRHHKLSSLKNKIVKSESSSPSSHIAVHKKISPFKKAFSVIENKNSAVQPSLKSAVNNKQTTDIDGDLSSPSTEKEAVCPSSTKHSSLLKSKNSLKQAWVEKNTSSPSSGYDKLVISSNETAVPKSQTSKQKLISPSKVRITKQLCSKSVDGSRVPGPTHRKHWKPQNNQISQNITPCNDLKKNVAETSTPSLQNHIKSDIAENLVVDRFSTIPSSTSSELDDRSFVTCQSNLSKTNEGEETEPSESEEFVSCPESPTSTFSETNVTRRTRGKSSVLVKDVGTEENSLLMALDLHDISAYWNETPVQSNDSLMPLNLCFKDNVPAKSSLPHLRRDEGKENFSSVFQAVNICSDFYSNGGKVNRNDESKTPRNYKNLESNGNCGIVASGTKVPSRKIPVFSSATKKPISKSAQNEKICAHFPSASEKKILSPSPMKKPHFCKVRNTIFSKVPQFVTPKKFVHIQSPVAQYIRNGQYCPPAKGANEPVLRDCMNNIDFQQQLNVASQDNVPLGGLSKLKWKQ